MSEPIVDLFQSVQIQEEQGELTRGALGPLDLSVQSFDQLAVIGEPGERVLGGLLAQVILELALLGDILDDDFVSRSLVRVADFASAEADFQDRAVHPLPVNFQGIGADGLEGVAEQSDALGGIAEDVAGEIGGEEVVAGGITEHGHQGLIDIQELAVEIAATHSIGEIADQGAVMRFGMAQLFLGQIALFAQIALAEGSTNGHGKVADVVHFNPIVGALRDERGHGFHLHFVGEQDERDLLLLQAQHLERLRALPIGGRVLNEHDVVVFRAQTFDELLGS